jgi:hypothetical protein
MHVDDAIVRCDNDAIEYTRVKLNEANVKIRYFKQIAMGTPDQTLGCTWLEQENGSYVHQAEFILNKLKPIDIAMLPRNGKGMPKGLTDDVYALYRSALGNLIWILHTHADKGVDISFLACKRELLCIDHVHTLNKLIWEIREHAHDAVFLPRFPDDDKYFVNGIADAAHASRPDGSSQGGDVVGAARRDSTPRIWSTV